MSKPLRIISVCLAVVVVVGLVTGIAIWSANTIPTEVVHEPGLYTDDQRIEDAGVMLTIGEHEVSFAEYRHYYLMMKSSVEYEYGSIDWTYDPDGQKAYILRSAADRELINQYTWLTIAKERGIALTDEELEQINTTLAEQKETHGDDFPSYLAEMFFQTEADYLQITANQQLAEKAQDALWNELSEEHGDAIFEESVLTAKHILISTASANPDGETYDENRALGVANELYREITESDDPAAKFDELRAQHDADSAGQPEGGYTFGRGEMVDAFYEGAKSLAENGISEPVKTDYGYHIIMRMPLNEEEAESIKTDVIYDTIVAYMDEEVARVEKTLPITNGAYYSALETVCIY